MSSSISRPTWTPPPRRAGGGAGVVRSSRRLGCGERARRPPLDPRRHSPVGRAGTSRRHAYPGRCPEGVRPRSPGCSGRSDWGTAATTRGWRPTGAGPSVRSAVRGTRRRPSTSAPALGAPPVTGDWPRRPGAVRSWRRRWRGSRRDSDRGPRGAGTAGRPAGDPAPRHTRAPDGLDRPGVGRCHGGRPLPCRGGAAGVPSRPRTTAAQARSELTNTAGLDSLPVTIDGLGAVERAASDLAHELRGWERLWAEWDGRTHEVAELTSAPRRACGVGGCSGVGCLGPRAAARQRDGVAGCPGRCHRRLGGRGARCGRRLPCTGGRGPTVPSCGPGAGREPRGHGRDGRFFDVRFIAYPNPNSKDVFTGLSVRKPCGIFFESLPASIR